MMNTCIDACTQSSMPASLLLFLTSLSRSSFECKDLGYSDQFFSFVPFIRVSLLPIYKVSLRILQGGCFPSIYYFDETSTELGFDKVSPSFEVYFSHFFFHPCLFDGIHFYYFQFLLIFLFYKRFDNFLIWLFDSDSFFFLFAIFLYEKCTSFQCKIPFINLAVYAWRLNQNLLLLFFYPCAYGD